MITSAFIVSVIVLLEALIVAAWAIGYFLYRPPCFTDVKAKRDCCATCRLYAKCNPVGRLVDKEGE